jgi:WD40 repeat protein
VIALGSSIVRPQIYDLRNGEQITLIGQGWHSEAISSVAFSASGQMLAVGSNDGWVSLWSAS